MKKRHILTIILLAVSVLSSVAAFQWTSSRTAAFLLGAAAGICFLLSLTYSVGAWIHERQAARLDKLERDYLEGIRAINEG